MFAFQASEPYFRRTTINDLTRPGQDTTRTCKVCMNPHCRNAVAHAHILPGDEANGSAQSAALPAAASVSQCPVTLLKSDLHTITPSEYDRATTVFIVLCVMGSLLITVQSITGCARMALCPSEPHVQWLSSRIYTQQAGGSWDGPEDAGPLPRPGCILLGVRAML